MPSKAKTGKASKRSTERELERRIEDVGKGIILGLDCNTLVIFAKHGGSGEDEKNLFEPFSVSSRTMRTYISTCRQNWADFLEPDHSRLLAEHLETLRYLQRENIKASDLPEARRVLRDIGDLLQLNSLNINLLAKTIIEIEPAPKPGEPGSRVKEDGTAM
ncbi:hypothetical protein LCGC14_2381730 [marine sediment metagenome]|uniref:Uncharacterized protein n=1 Tax=marine sediment metagenome TaxID=412755 RepID=A0A0F9CMY7_9ZZZZ